MEPLKLWLPFVLSLIFTSLIGVIAARIRFSASRQLRLTLDILFLLPLAIPDIVIWFYQIQGVTIMPTEVLWTLPVFYFLSVMKFRKIAPEMLDAVQLQGLGQCGIFWRVFFPLARLWILGGFAIGILRYYVVLFCVERSVV